MAIWPFVILKDRALKNDIYLMNHEQIHLKQQKELLVIGFFIWYLLEFLVKLCKYRAFMPTYRNISFEREAYQYDQDLNYLKHRKHWSFIKFLNR